MEFESSLDDLKRDSLRKCCRPSFKSNWLKNKGALLVPIWSFLCIPMYHYFTLTKISHSPIKGKLPLHPDATILMGLLLPIGSWLVDALVGRYRMIRCDMHLEQC